MKSEKLINFIIPIICGALLVIIVALTFWQIILRNCFNSTLSWSDDISQFAMSWLALFGSIWATQNNKHLQTGIKLHNKFNKRLSSLIEAILALMLAGIAGLLVHQSTIFCITAMNTESLALPWLKMGYVFAVLPLVMFFLCCFYLKSSFKNLACVFKKIPDPDLPGQVKE
jgi:TRAP-type C4-dicarboxylate transport system permease small subunit